MLKRFGLAALLFSVLPFSASGDEPPAISTATEGAVVPALPVTPTASWRTVTHNAFAPGEELLFSIKWGVIVGGYANLSIPEIVDFEGRPAYHIVSEARSGGVVSAFYKVKDRNDVWLDQRALITLKYEKRIKEGKFHIEETSELNQVKHHWKTHAYRIDKNKFEDKEGNLPLNALDSFGSLYYIRTLPLEVGKSYTVDVHNGDKVYPLVVNVLKREKVKVSAGKFKCLLVEPMLRGPGIFISKGKKLQVWMTDDARHMPVRMRSEVFIGHVSAELTSYK